MASDGELRSAVAAASSATGNDAKSSMLSAYTDKILPSPQSVMVTRPLLTNLISALNSFPPEVQVKVGSYISEKLQPQLASFEEQDAAAREVLANGYEAEEDYTLAAKHYRGLTWRRHKERSQMWPRCSYGFVLSDYT